MYLLAPGHWLGLDHMSCDRKLLLPGTQGEKRCCSIPLRFFMGCWPQYKDPGLNNVHRLIMTLIWELSLLIRVGKQLPCMASSLTTALSAFIIWKMNTGRPVASPNCQSWGHRLQSDYHCLCCWGAGPTGFIHIDGSQIFHAHYIYFLYMPTVDIYIIICIYNSSIF